MTIRFAGPRDPRKLPEYVLWRMTKAGRAVEARTRIVPLGEGAPELRILYTNEDGTFDLGWSVVLKDGHEVRELAQQKQREFEVRGWALEPPTSDVGEMSS